MKSGAKIGTILLTSAILVYLSLCIAWHQSYDPTFHNCMHMSEELEDLLELVPGINAEIVWGHDEPSHMWVRVGTLNIESTWAIPESTPTYEGEYPHQEVFQDYSEFACIYLRE